MSRLLDWFPCLYRRTNKAVVDRRLCFAGGLLRRRCGIARLTICLLNVSPVNDKLPLPSYVHQYIFSFFGDVHPCHSNTNNKVCFRIILPINRPPSA